jgi:predicted permease
VLWFLAFRLVLAPLLMVGIAEAVNLKDPEARAAVLVASIPIAIASFTLAEEYHIGEALLTKAVVFGTALLLPTAILVLEGLDNAGKFKFTKVKLAAPGAAGAGGY